MPTHERPERLLTAARSVLDQQGVEVELVIVDDASSDTTAETVSELAADPRVVALHNDVSLGPSGTRNAGIARARGDFLAFVDDDDVLLPGAAAALVGALRDDPDLGVVTPWYEVVHERTGTTADFRGPIGFGAEELHWFNFIGIPFGVVRRDAFAEDIRFDPSLPVSEDWDVFLRCAMERPIGVVPRRLYGYHQHGGPRVTAVRDDARAGFAHFLAKHRGTMTPACRAYHEAVIAGQSGGRAAMARSLATVGRHAPADALAAGTVLAAAYTASTVGTRRRDPGLPSRTVYRLLTTPRRRPTGTR